MNASPGKHGFSCAWPWTTLVLLCDGRLTCGCADPYARRVVGDAQRESVAQVWRGPLLEKLRRELNQGWSDFCGDCPLKCPLPPGSPAAPRSDPGPRPNRLFIESTAVCNLSCYKSCCAPESGIIKTRRRPMLDFELFRKVIDECGPQLVRIDLFNYGETFLHRRAVDMAAYIKERFPAIYLYSSTNGLAFRGDDLERLVGSGIDELTFSVDGASQESYARYRRRGDFDRVLANLAEAVAIKRRAGLDVPVINWRYILFRWNDSDREMNRARKLAARIGVDRLSWEITDHPEDAYSTRFQPGNPDYEKISRAVWDDNNLGNAIPGASPRALIKVPLKRRRGLRLKPGQSMTLTLKLKNRGDRPWPRQASYGRRLVRLGAQLYSAAGELLERDFQRAWLSADVPGRGRTRVEIELTAPAEPGSYRLKFDLVSEGIDWFEACGSRVTWLSLLVE